MDYLVERHLRLPDGTFPHLGTTNDGSVAEVVLLSGSPERVELMATMLEGVERVGDRRGYAVYTGGYQSRRITVATSGVGAPSTSIAIEELGACGGRIFIRVGSCASIAESVAVGNVVVAYGAVSDEGTSRYYAPPNFPPIATPRVVTALIDAAQHLRVQVHVGLTRSTDSFYEGERRVEIIDLWRDLGVLTFEMETSALFTVAAVRGWEAGAIFVSGSNLITGQATYQGDHLQEYRDGQARMVDVALAAAAALASE